MDALTRISYLYVIIDYAVVDLKRIPALMCVHPSWYEALVSYSPLVWNRCFAKARLIKKAPPLQHIVTPNYDWGFSAPITGDALYRGHQEFLKGLFDISMNPICIVRALEHSLHNKQLNWIVIIHDCIHERKWQPAIFALEHFPKHMFPNDTFRYVCQFYCHKTIEAYASKGFCFRSQDEANKTLCEVWQWGRGRGVKWLNVMIFCGAIPTVAILQWSIAKQDYESALYMLENGIITKETGAWSTSDSKQYINFILEHLRSCGDKEVSKMCIKLLQLLLETRACVYVSLGDSSCHIHKATRAKDIMLLSLFLTKLEGKERKNALTIIHRERHTFDKSKEDIVIFLKQIATEIKNQ